MLNDEQLVRQIQILNPQNALLGQYWRQFIFRLSVRAYVQKCLLIPYKLLAGILPNLQL